MSAKNVPKVLDSSFLEKLLSGVKEPAQRDLLEFAYVNVLLRTGKKEAARKILLDRRPAFYQASAITGLTD